MRAKKIDTDSRTYSADILPTRKISTRKRNREKKIEEENRKKFEENS